MKKRIRLQAKQLNLRFDNVEIVSLDEAEATANADVHAAGISKRSERHADSFRVEIRLQKRSDNWTFHQFTYPDSLHDN